MNFCIFGVKISVRCLFFFGVIFLSSCSNETEYHSEAPRFQDEDGTLAFNWPATQFMDNADRSFFGNGWEVFLRYNGESGYYPVDVLSLFARRGEVEVKIDSIEALNKIDAFRIDDEKQVLRYLNIFFKDDGFAFYFSTPWVVGTKTGNAKIRREEDGFLIEREVFVLEHERLKPWGVARLCTVREKLSFDGKYMLLDSKDRLRFSYRLSGDVVLFHMDQNLADLLRLKSRSGEFSIEKSLGRDNFNYH